MIQIIENFSREHMWFELAHDYDHADRVRNRALKIAKEEGFENLVLVEVSALLHDIGLSVDEPRKLHWRRWSIIAEEFLSKYTEISKEDRDEICNAIHYHNSNRKWEWKLLHILRDADRMELFWSIGISRWLQSKPNHLINKSGYLRWETRWFTPIDFDKRFDNENGLGIWDTIVDQINFQISCYDDMHTESWKVMALPLVEQLKDFIKNIEQECILQRK